MKLYQVAFVVAAITPALTSAAAIRGHEQNDPALEKRNDDDDKNDDSKPDGKPNFCVSLDIYKDMRCNGEPVRILKVPTYAKKGSDCYHDKTMPHYSVSNQYCNMKTGNWHETLHLGSEDCSTNWWNWWSPLDLTFTPDSCVAGMKLRKCSKGPCEKDDTIDLWHASAMGRW